jgi:predicted DNA-binding protein
MNRAAIGVFLRLTENQVDALTGLADATGKTLPAYLRDIAEDAIDQMIPPTEGPAGSTQS